MEISGEQILINSLKDMKGAIENLGRTLNDRIDGVEDKLDEYATRIVILEEAGKHSLPIKILLTIVGALIGYIVNHKLG